MGFKNIDSELLKKIAAKLVQASNPTKIILFGSWARNEMREGSDMEKHSSSG